MRKLIKFNGEVIGSVLTNHSMTFEEICEIGGITLARTQEDYEGMPENGMYDPDDLEIVDENNL